MERIFITGHPHTGTTILRNIFGHISGVYEIKDETEEFFYFDDSKNLEYKHPVLHWQKIQLDDSINYIVAKNPLVNIFSSIYEDYIKVFIIRNPLYVFSSLNKRFGTYRDDRLHQYEKSAEDYLTILNERKDEKNMYCIKYEDMFPNSFEKLKDVFDSIGLIYSVNVFNNKRFYNEIGENQFDKEKVLNAKRVSRKNHALFRARQINLPFKNLNDKNKIYLSQKQKDFFKNSDAIKQIYPEILN